MVLLHIVFYPLPDLDPRPSEFDGLGTFFFFPVQSSNGGSDLRFPIKPLPCFNLFLRISLLLSPPIAVPAGSVFEIVTCIAPDPYVHLRWHASGFQISPQIRCLIRMCISSLGSEETVLLPSMPWKDVVHTTCIARTGCMDDIFAMAADDRNDYGYFLLGISYLWWLSFERDGFPEGRLSLAFLVCSPGTQGNRDRSCSLSWNGVGDASRSKAR